MMMTKMGNLKRAVAVVLAASAQAWAGPSLIPASRQALAPLRLGAAGAMLVAAKPPALSPMTSGLLPAFRPPLALAAPISFDPGKMPAEAARAKGEAVMGLSALGNWATWMPRTKVSGVWSSVSVLGRSPAYRSVPVAKDPVTRLYGVSPTQLKVIVSILKKRYGASLLDLAAIGSRAKGRASELKEYQPPTESSDLDLAPLLRDTHGAGPDSLAVAREIEAAVGIPIQLHGVLSAGESRFGESVPFYGGGYETWQIFSSGEAVRIPLD